MNPVFSRKALKALQLLSCSIIASFSLNGCGGGGGGGSSSEPQVAPASLENVSITLFNAFTVKFFRLAGSIGNESGAVDYDFRQSPFRVATADNNQNVGIDVAIPVLLQDVGYTYVRNSPTTGRITLTWTNIQQYPHPLATEGNPRVGPLGDLFWGGPGFTQTSLILDVLFVDTGGFIGTTTVRVRSANRYSSTFTPPGPALVFVNPFEFDSIDAQFRIDSGRLPAGYNPDFTPETPSSAVWPSLTGRTIDFDGNDLSRRIAQRTTTAPQIMIPGATVEDAGTLLVDVPVEMVNGGDGIYSYARTGGSGAKVAIRYPRVVGGITQTVNVLYTLTFDSLDGGTFVDSNGATGTFLQDTFTNVP